MKKYIFDEIAKNWWKKNNICRPLHITNNIRFNYIKSKTEINKKAILDLGCGGGILSEKLAKHGGNVIGLDKSKELIKIAKIRNKSNSFNIKYIKNSIKKFNDSNSKKFDIIICMEILEHMNNKKDLLSLINQASKKNSIIILSSLNKNIITYMYMILFGEFLTKKIPINTHSYEKLTSPNILKNIEKIKIIDIKGINYNNLLSYSNIKIMSQINYIITLKKC